MAEVRKVEGLEHIDINVQNSDPSMIVLYYHWRTQGHAEAYRKGDLIKRAGDALEPDVAERRIITMTNVD